MSDSEGDDQLLHKIEKTKQASKVTNSDNAALLCSDDEIDETDEYTDIFGDNNITGSIVTATICGLDEGDSVSATDSEIMGYTGDAEMYTEDAYERDQDLDTTEEVIVKEGTLIKINDDVEDASDVKEYPSEDKSIATSLTNDSISEIANKLEEVKVSPNNPKPGNPVKVEEFIETNMNELDIKQNFDSDITSNKESDGQDIDYSDEASQHQASGKHKKKTLRRHTLSTHEKDNVVAMQEELNSSGDFFDDIDPFETKKVNGHNSSDIRPNKKEKRKKREKQNEVKHSSDKKEKLIDVESPPQTPAITVNNTINNTKQESIKKPVKFSRPQNKRKRTRHKIYLDDPDVHQLISDHVILLHKFIEDVQSGKHMSKKSPPKNEGKAIPIQFVHGQSSQQFNARPYEGHRLRGKNLMTRIKNGETTSSSDEDDDNVTNQIVGNKYRNTGHPSRYSKVEMYDVCPDCGEQHPPDEAVELQDVCPDCGVRHSNPYQHSPNKKPWQKYVDACKDTLTPGQQYQQVSTEQDPEDIKQETLPSIDGPHSPEELSDGVRYKLKYLGSSQIVTQHPVTKETRMQQAQEAYNRIKGQDDDDEDDVSTNVDMFLSLERIKILNQDTKFEDVMMDHALQTVCFICDMGKILVLMARRLTSDHSTDFSIEQGKPISLGSIVGDREKKTSKNICHVFEGEEDASKIAKAIGQAFNIAYRQFLQSNGIAHEHVEEAEYCHVLESQKLVGADLDRLTDKSNAKEVVVVKKRGEALGIMLLESGWGSMLPTVFIAHLANYSAAVRCQQLTVGDHILSCNGASLVGLPISECNTVLRNTRSSNRVILSVVSCPPVVDVVLSRPDVKYQLGFSVQNGTICSLLRGGIAERGGVRVGHRIIEINGDSVVAKSHQHIVDILANTIGSISMKTMPVAMYRLMVGDDLPQHV